MKKKMLLLILPLMIICLLTGCSQRIGIYYSCRNMPENSKIHILLKLDTDEPLKPKQRTDSEIENYSEDGWYCGDIYVDGIIVYDYDNTFSFYEDGNALKPKEIAEKYGSLKIAVTDKEGRILQISPEFRLVREDKNLCWNSIEFDYIDNQIKGVKNEIFDDRWDEINTFSVFLLMSFNVIVWSTIISMNQKNYKRFWVLDGLLIFAAGLFIYSSYMVYFDDYYGVSEFDYSYQNLVFVSGLIVCSIGFSIWGWKKYIGFRCKSEEEQQ